MFWTLTIAILAGGYGVGPTVTSQYGVAVPIEDPSGKALNSFHNALRQTAQNRGKTRILQFGASHTAADIFTGRMRRTLQKRFGDGGHGWLMPAKPFKYYRHEGISFEGPKKKRHRWHWDFARNKPRCHDDGRYGLAGMSIMARSKRQWARFRTSRGKGLGTRVSRIEVLYAKQRRGGHLYLTVDGRRRRRIRTRGKGGLGRYTLNLKERSHSFHMAPRGNGWVRLFGVILETRGSGVVVDTMGINGTRVRQMLRWQEAQWRQLVRQRNPALVVLWYGTNEAGDEHVPMSDYEQNLRAALKRIKRAAPRASCVIIGPTDNPKVFREDKKDPNPRFEHRHRTDQIIASQRKISAEFECGFWDAVAVTGGRFSIVNWSDASPRLAWSDYIHFTSRGYKRLADLFTAALISGYDLKYGQ